MATVVAASAVSVAVLSVLPSLMLPPLLLLLQGGALLVTADGAVDCAMDPNRQVSGTAVAALSCVFNRSHKSGPNLGHSTAFISRIVVNGRCLPSRFNSPSTQRQPP